MIISEVRDDILEVISSFLWACSHGALALTCRNMYRCSKAPRACKKLFKLSTQLGDAHLQSLNLPLQVLSLFACRKVTNDGLVHFNRAASTSSAKFGVVQDHRRGGIPEAIVIPEAPPTCST